MRIEMPSATALHNRTDMLTVQLNGIRIVAIAGRDHGIKNTFIAVGWYVVVGNELASDVTVRYPRTTQSTALPRSM